MHYMLKIVNLMMRAVGTSLSKEGYKLLKAKKFDELVAIEPASLETYGSAHHYFGDAQASALVRKLPGLPTTRDLHEEAVKTYFECEEQNRATNARLARFENWLSRGFVGDELDHRLYLHIRRVRELIANVLGNLPTREDLIPYRLSGGSTYYDKGEEITIPHKMGSVLAVTPGADLLCNYLIKETLWYDSSLRQETVRGNRFTSVPKDSKKNRGICIEPICNIAIQLAVGGLIRRKLYQVGIQIDGLGQNNAQHRHRELAREASTSGSLATIDLSNASDLVSYMLVKILLPKGWFDLLNTLRSPETQIGDKWYKNHKFSSMGNGYTFELETLIFWALAQSCTEGYASAYGDDILIGAQDAPGLIQLLTLFGLTVNMKKSFWDPSGCFRESCGGDYWRGQDVRPVFLTVNPSNPTEWIVLHNQLDRLRYRGFNDHLIDKAMQLCVEAVPISLRLFGPPGLDSVFVGPSSKWKTRRKRLNYCFIGDHEREDPTDAGYDELRQVHTINRSVALGDFSPEVQLASALLGTPSSGATLRDSVSGWKPVWR